MARFPFCAIVSQDDMKTAPPIATLAVYRYGCEPGKGHVCPDPSLSQRSAKKLRLSMQI